MALAATAKADPVVLGAAETARTALLEVAEPDTVGDHLDATMLGERLAVHRFACTSSAYVGWEWTVSVTRASRQKVATVCESALVPGEGALLSPRWVPYADRLAPGDLRPSDVLPFQDDDPLLVQGFEELMDPSYTSGLATSSPWPARCGPPSGSARTSGPRPTGESSHSGTAAGRTARPTCLLLGPSRCRSRSSTS